MGAPKSLLQDKYCVQKVLRDKKITDMNKTCPRIYKDYLVEISGRGIVFDWYYFPFGSKRVPFEDIEWIAIRRLAPGDWKCARVWGTGDFTTWFPLDVDRPKKSVIFQLKLRDKNKYIGFTVEDDKAAEAVIKDLGLCADIKPSRQINPLLTIVILAVVGFAIVLNQSDPSGPIQKFILTLGSIVAISSGLMMIMTIRTLVAFYKARAEYRRG
jgi:hypothetical protein